MAQTPPAFDGKTDTWENAHQLAMLNPKVNGEDCSGFGYLTWDSQFLYVSVNMRDNDVYNKQVRPKLYRGDSLELFVSSEPRDASPGYGPHDHQFFITPDSAEGKPIVGEVVDREAGVVMDVKDVRYHISKTGIGWIAQIALPWSTFRGFEPTNGNKLALEMRVNDQDHAHQRFSIDPEDGNVVHNNPSLWSLLILGQ